MEHSTSSTNIQCSGSNKFWLRLVNLYFAFLSGQISIAMQCSTQCMYYTLYQNTSRSSRNIQCRGGSNQFWLLLVNLPNSHDQSCCCCSRMKIIRRCDYNDTKVSALLLLSTNILKLCRFIFVFHCVCLSGSAVFVGCVI